MDSLDHLLALAPADRLIFLAYLGSMAALAVYGLHRYGLVLAARRARRQRQPLPGLPTTLPIVTVQLPVFNERSVVERLLRDTAGLDWPRERLEIQVLDDSTDDTCEIVARLVDELQRSGIDIVHLRRSDRVGFKAGALAAGLAAARGELIAIFDADFRPPSHLLRAVVGEFYAPGAEDVAMVQMRWGHLNRGRSLLTRLQALFLDGHFLVDQLARAARGVFFNFNGTAGVWRREAIAAAGGWQADTLTEDLDLSYRAQLAGWRFLYRPDVVAPAELPEDINAYKGQQHRWAKGSAQTARKLLPKILRSALPRRVKLEALFHLTGNFAYPLLLAVAVLAYPALERRLRDGWSQTLWLDLPFFLLGTVSVAAFYAGSLRREGGGAGRWLLLPPLMALGIGMAVNNTRAVLAGLAGHRSEFLRTAKRGDRRRAGYRVKAPWWSLLEAALGVHFTLLVGRAIGDGLYLSVPFLGLFAAGFLAVAALSLGAALRPLRTTAASDEQAESAGRESAKPETRGQLSGAA